MTEKLKIVIPKVKFKDSSIDDVVKFIKKSSKNLDTNGTGVNIILMKNKALEKAKINLDADNMPVGEVIKYVCQQVKAPYKVEKHAIIIGSTARFQQMSTVFYLAPGKLIDAVDKQYMGDFEAFLKQLGVRFAPGSKVVLVRGKSRLIITNTQEEHNKLTKFLRKI